MPVSLDERRKAGLIGSANQRFQFRANFVSTGSADRSMEFDLSRLGVAGTVNLAKRFAVN